MITSLKTLILRAPIIFQLFTFKEIVSRFPSDTGTKKTFCNSQNTLFYANAKLNVLFSFYLVKRHTPLNGCTRDRLQLVSLLRYPNIVLNIQQQSQSDCSCCDNWDRRFRWRCSLSTLTSTSSRDIRRDSIIVIIPT